MEGLDRLLTAACFYFLGSAVIVFFALVTNHSEKEEGKSFLKRLIIFLISVGTIIVVIKESLQ